MQAKVPLVTLSDITMAGRVDMQRWSLTNILSLLTGIPENEPAQVELHAGHKEVAQKIGSKGLLSANV